MLNFKHLILGVLGAFSLDASAELISNDIIKKPSENVNLAHQVITKDVQSFNGFAKKSNSNPTTDGSILDKLNNLATSTVQNFTQNGVASWYGRQFHGRKTANGEVFNMNDLTAAHKSLPLNCKIRVTNKANGKSVVVRVNDRGPFHGNRVVDLSYGAAKVLGIVNTGTANVLVERIPN